MKTTKAIYSLTFIFFLSLGSLFSQSNYYVNGLNGNDDNSGISSSKAFKTLQRGVEVLGPGDTLNIMEGTYYNDDFGNGDVWKNSKTLSIHSKNGLPNAYIVIRPQIGDHVKLRGDGLYIVQIRNSSYIKIEGFEVEGEVENIPIEVALEYQFAYRYKGTDEVLYRVPFGTPPEVVESMNFETLSNIERPSYTDTKGIVMQKSHHITIENNLIHHLPGTGLRFNNCDYGIIRRNEIHNCSRKSYSGTHAFVLDSSESIDEYTGPKYIVEGNLVHHNYNEIYSWSPTKTIITPVIDEGKGISLQRNDVSHGWTHGRILLVNNVTHHNGYSGLHSNSGRGIDFINNTSFMDHLSSLGRNHGISLQGTSDARIVNNIVYHDEQFGGFGIAASSDSDMLQVENNLVFGRIDADIAQVEQNTIYGNPQFLDIGKLNFSLALNSPAIGAANKDFNPETDYYGILRDENPDLGAIEYVGENKTDFESLSAEIKGDYVELNWTTSFEYGNVSFHVERSSDYIIWEELGSKESKGNSTEAQSYSYLDSLPSLGKSYYRVKQKGEQGDSTYSDTICIEITAITINVIFNILSATLNEEDHVDLEWSMSSEEGNAYYVVERSSDEMVWDSILRIETGQESYFAKDSSPIEGESFYRIKQVDIEGGNSFSNTANVTYNPIIVSVVFSNFSALLNEEDHVDLEWSMSSEEGNAYYVVERSSDEMVWDSILRIETGQESYFAKDSSPIEGESFYRIKQVDIEGGNSFSNTANVTFNPIVVSVVFSDFSALLNEEVHVDLEWSMSSEEGNAYYVVERSSDEMVWDSILRIETGQESYFAKDSSPIEGESFYRIKQVDVLNDFSFSDTLEINLEISGTWETSEKNRITIYPNPVERFIWINISGGNALVVQVYNASGMLVKSSRVNKENPLDCADLLSGFYFLKIRNFTYKFLKI